MDNLFRWILAGVMLLGSPFVAVGVGEGLKTESELRQSRSTRGTIVDNRLVAEQRDGVEEHAYQPVVEYRDESGAARRFTDAVGSLPADYAVGESVDIAYARDGEARPRILSWKRLWLVPTLLSAVGVLPGLVCFVILRRLSRLPSAAAKS